MNALRKIFPVAVFGLSLAVTLISRKSETSVQKVSLPENSPARPTKTARAESTFAAVRALLRDGKIGDARELLRQLAAEDPVAFFKLLAKLPGLPGMEDIVRETAGRLPWNQQNITDLLNKISNNELRDLAWASYINPQVGVLSDEEVFSVGIKAREHRSMSAMGGLFKDAAEKRPDAFLAFLNTSDSTFLRVEFFEELMKFHPERAAGLFHSIPDGTGGGAYDKSYILQTRINALPTSENLQIVLMERGSRSIYNWADSTSLISAGYPAAIPQERTKILAWMQSLPPLARNRLLDGIVYTTATDYGDPISPAELSSVLNSYTSGYLQERALNNWLERNKDWDQTNPGWIDLLPTERLRNHMIDLRKNREADPKP